METSSRSLVASPVASANVPHRHPVARHPLLGYFVLAYAGTWLTLLPLVLSNDGIGVLPYKVPFAVFAILFILSGLAGPTLAAFTMSAATEGRAGVRRLVRRYVTWRVGPQWYLLVLFGYVAFYLAIAGITLGTGPLSAALPKWPLLFTAYLPMVLTFNLVTALGEEPGWRGFALPRLQEKYGPVVGSVLLGTLHAGWHLPVFFLPALGFGTPTVGFFVTWIPAVWATTVLWTWIFNSTKGSVLIAILLHASFDGAGSFVTAQLVSFAGMSEATKSRATLVQLALFIGVTLIVLTATRGRLGYRESTASVASAVQ